MAQNTVNTVFADGTEMVTSGNADEGTIMVYIQPACWEEAYSLKMDIEDCKDMLFALNKALYDAGWRKEGHDDRSREAAEAAGRRWERWEREQHRGRNGRNGRGERQ